jgi:hypothetical protein
VKRTCELWVGPSWREDGPTLPPESAFAKTELAVHLECGKVFENGQYEDQESDYLFINCFYYLTVPVGNSIHLGRGYISVRNAVFLTRRLERVSGRLFTSAFFL